MLFGTVNGVGRGMGVLDWGGDRRRRRGSFGGEFGASHCNQWGRRYIVVRERRDLPKSLREGLVSILYIVFCVIGDMSPNGCTVVSGVVGVVVVVVCNRSQMRTSKCTYMCNFWCEYRS